MRKLIVGQILRDGKVMGTGFLVESDIVMTVKHNIVEAGELITEFEEKEVAFRIGESDEVVGKTINLVEAIEKRIDCVFIRLSEVLSETEMYELTDAENEIEGVGCQIIGFPKLVTKKTTICGTITDTQEEKLIITIKKEDQLQNYEGFSGAPVIVLGNIIGIAKKQENSEKIEALPIKYIHIVLECEEITIKKREIPVNVSEGIFNLKSLTQKVEQVISMVGPRYSKELNVKTGTYSNLMYAYTLAKQMAAIQRRCKKIESRLSLNQPLVVDGTGTLLDIYVYQSYQLENIEIKEFRDGLTLMEHMVLKYLLQERDIENSIGYGYRMRKIIEHAKISLRQKAVEYYGWSYIRSMFA